jgi:hypothetical protein
MTTDPLTGHPKPLAGFGPIVPRPKVQLVTSQPSDGPGVVWFQNRPWCATCDTALNIGSTASPKHDLECRPTRVPLCPVCAGGGS